MTNPHANEEIDAIMAEMEAKTPASGSTFSFDKLKVDEIHVEVRNEADATDAKGFFSSMLPKMSPKPGILYPSRPTSERYYDFTNTNMGVALVFNQVRFKEESERNGSNKDANDLNEVLTMLGFDVKIFTDLSVAGIKKALYAVSIQDHSDNDCLCVIILTHGNSNGRIFAADNEFNVQELWEFFTGNNCETLIGKPKLFFIQACRGSMTDPGILMKPKPLKLLRASDAVDAKPVREFFVIPTLADLLVMYSTAEGFYSFRNPKDGSWFIQALCEELKKNHHEDLMIILTGVNRRVAFAKQSNVPDRSDWDAMKQMPNIVSMLTKTFYFTKKLKNLKLDEA